MPEPGSSVYIPYASTAQISTPTPNPTPNPNPNRRIVVDPITRIEGHLRIEAQVEDGVVQQAWSAGTTFRGIELILRNRDPRDAWVFTQRLCGVCTTVHALASVRAVEDALGVPPPPNAHLIRNLIECTQFIHDHVIHFYHLHGPDWVDAVSALSADPAGTSRLAQQQSDWPNNSASYFAEVKAKLQNLVSSGQLSIFANGYWGHPAYHLAPEANLLVLAHYLEALSWQRELIRIHAILGGKNPHLQTYLVGGMATPISSTTGGTINATSLATMRQLAQAARNFVTKVYVPDVRLVAGAYPEWTAMGTGPGNFLAYGDFPVPPTDELWLPSGIVLNKDLARHFAFDNSKVTEAVAHSWYADSAPVHPSQGETVPNFTGPQPPYEHLLTEGKYSWLKAPRYDGQVMEVGPLARMSVAYAAGHPRVRALLDGVLADLGWPTTNLFSTLGRILARSIETLLFSEQVGVWIDAIDANMRAGSLDVFNGARWDPATWPTDCFGFGATEAPRGALGHWVHIQNGTISNYQMVVPSTWNGSPRDGQQQPGAWEQALAGVPVYDPAQPLEILRTVHSFDPCMACAVHVLDGVERRQVRVTTH